MQFEPLHVDSAELDSAARKEGQPEPLVHRVLRRLRLGTFVLDRPLGYHSSRRQLAARGCFPEEDWLSIGVPDQFVRTVCNTIQEICDLPSAHFEPIDSLELVFRASHDDFDMANILFTLGRRFKIKEGMPEPRRAYEENKTVGDFVRMLYLLTSGN
jgi:hypothetical protein